MRSSSQTFSKHLSSLRAPRRRARAAAGETADAAYARFDEDLDEVEDAEVALEVGDGEDEVERRVVAVDELRRRAPLRDAPLEVVAERVGPLGDLLEDLAHDLLLRVLGAVALLVHRLEELADARLAVVVHDDDALDHGGGALPSVGGGDRPEGARGAARGVLRRDRDDVGVGGRGCFEPKRRAGAARSRFAEPAIRDAWLASPTS